MANRRTTIVAAALAAVLALSSCSGGSGEDEPPAAGTDAATTGSSEPSDQTTPPTSVEEGVSLIAQAIPADVQVFASASEDEPTTSLDNPNENDAPLTFLVEEDLGEWLKVLLPIRPNGSTGYVQASDVNLMQTSYRVDIRLSEHRLIVTKGDEVVADEPIGVGTASTPTPGGRYYIKELLQPTNPDGAYGPYAFGLSGFSNVLDEFNGGDGVIGIHGTNEPNAIGTDVSHGCIRMSNEAITELARILPLGTPVEIEA